MEVVKLVLVGVFVLALRSVSMYAMARLLVYNPRNLLAKSVAVGCFGGLIAMVVVFFPLGSLLVFLIDYALVKGFFDLNRLMTLGVVFGAGLISQVPVFILRQTVFG
jgi:hypothetical protein